MAIKKAKGTVLGGAKPGQASIVDSWTTAPKMVNAGAFVAQQTSTGSSTATSAGFTIQ